MAKIYSSPQEIEVPKFNHITFREDCKKYENDLREWCKKHSKDKYAGEIIDFPVADGKAMYMVFSLRPLKLIHIDLLDGYDFPYAHRLTAQDVKEKIEGNKTMEKLFGKRDF